MTQLREHCGELPPDMGLIRTVPAGECVLRPGHTGSHAADNGMRWTLNTPAPSALREQYAAAIASYDHAVGQATDPAPRSHHYGQADAVMAVRDRELEEARAERDRWRQRAEKRAARYEEIEAAEQRVRSELDDLCREPHPSHDHVCPDDVRRYILRALDEPPASA